MICAICYDNIKQPKKLACDHTYCRACITKWCNINNKCPVCRYELESKEIEIEKPQNVQTTHPFGPHNRRAGFYTFLDNYYEAQEQNMIQRAIEESLLDNNPPDDSDDDLETVD